MNTISEKSIFAPINRATGEEIQLALQELRLTGTVLPVGANLQVRHIFKSSENRPIEVVYAFGLPRDAALRRFRIVGEGFSVSSELKPTKEAVKIYERGIDAGHLSTLARQYEDGVVNLSVGNVRPGETVAVYLDILAGVDLKDDGLRLRFPFTLAPGYHAKARSIESSPGMGEMELPEEFGDVLLPKWMKNSDNLHGISFQLNVALPHMVAEIGSPSHAIKVSNEPDGNHIVRLAPEREVPNRDLVLDIRTQKPLTGVTGGIGSDGRGHFALIVPSSSFGGRETEPRRMVFLIDRSGSMDGTPMAQAIRAVEACLGTLSEQDKFSVIAFDSEVEMLSSDLLSGDSSGREAARKFLKNLDARGGTELTAGFMGASRLLGNDGGDVIILTDGQVYGTDKILAKARSAGVRIHCLGIGSASQDRFLTLLARETGGISKFMTPRERVDLAAVELFASIGQPVASGLNIDLSGTGSVILDPKPPKTVFTGNPLVLYGELEGTTETEITMSWIHEGKPEVLQFPVKLVENAESETVFALQGSRLITDAESKYITETSYGQAGQRENERQTRVLENLSKKFGLASRAMSLVAVVKRKEDESGNVPKTMIVPVGMPSDTAFDSYFGENQIEALRINASPYRHSSIACYAPSFDEDVERPRASPKPQKIHSRIAHSPSIFHERIMPEETATNENATIDDTLMALATMMEPDGGMPGKDDDERWIASSIALILYMRNGHTVHAGTFRMQVKRLKAYVESRGCLLSDLRISPFINRINSGDLPHGDWHSLAQKLLVSGHPDQTAFWLEVSKK